MNLPTASLAFAAIYIISRILKEAGMTEGDRALARLAMILQGERWRERPPIFEVAPDLFLTLTIVTADQLRSNLPPLFAEVIA